ncbi:hypothetical protein Tco_1345239 [Tanacetum coccineum]
MVAFDEAGFDWSFMADKEFPTNLALMAFSDSEVYNHKTCSDTCLKPYETLKSQYDNLRVEFNKSEFDLATYKRGLFAPPTIDLSSSGLKEFQQPEFEGYGVNLNKSVSENSANEIKKTTGAPIIQDWVSDCDEDESEVMVSNNVQHKSELKPEQAKQPRKIDENPRNNRTNWNEKKTQKLGVRFQFTKKAYFVCGSFNHLIKDCNFHDKKMVQKPVMNNVQKGTGQREVRPVWNNALRTNHQNFSNSRRNFAPTAVLTKSGIVPISTARQRSSRAAAPLSAARPINTAAPKLFVNVAKTKPNVFQKAHSLSRRPFNQQTALNNRSLNNKVNTAKVNSVNTAKGKRVTSAVGKQGINVVKSSACWVWRPKRNIVDHTSKNSGSYICKQFDYVDPTGRLNIVYFALKYDWKDLLHQTKSVKHIGKSKEARTLRYLSLVVPLTKVGDEVVHKELGDRMERVATTVSSLEAKQDSEKTITEASLRRHLKLEDNGGVTTLPNSEIFEQLALMGYATDSEKLTFQKGNFSPQWRFFIHTILHCLSPKKTAWEQFSSNIATVIICLETTRTFNFSKFIFNAMVKKIDNPYKFLMYPRFIQIYLNKQRRLIQPHTITYSTPVLTHKVFSNMKRVTKGYSWEDTPLFASMITASETSPSRITSSPSLSPQHTPFTTPSTSQPSNIYTTPVTEEAASMPHESPLQSVHSLGHDEGSLSLHELMVLCTNLSNKVTSLEAELAQTKQTYGTALTKLIKKVKKLEQTVKTSQSRRRTRVVLSDEEEVFEDPSKRGRSLIEELDLDAEISLVPPHDAEIQEKISDDTKEQEVTTADTTLNTASVPISTASATPEVSTAAANLVYIRRSAKKRKDKGSTKSFSCACSISVSDMLCSIDKNLQLEVLWLQNQLLDYGYNFMKTKIHVDNESAICVVKNPIYHSKTKYIEIRHHFIRGSYEKKLIEMVKIHIDYNVADLLTKAFDVTRLVMSCHKELGARIEGLPYALSLEAEQDSDAQTRFEAASKSLMIHLSQEVHWLSVYIRRIAEKGKDKGKAIMIEDEFVQKKSKKQLEQERLSHEEAIRLQEQIDEEERKRIARDVEIAKQLQEEYDKDG